MSARPPFYLTRRELAGFAALSRLGLPFLGALGAVLEMVFLVKHPDASLAVHWNVHGQADGYQSLIGLVSFEGFLYVLGWGSLLLLRPSRLRRGRSGRRWTHQWRFASAYGLFAALISELSVLLVLNRSTRAGPGPPVALWIGPLATLAGVALGSWLARMTSAPVPVVETVSHPTPEPHVTDVLARMQKVEPGRWSRPG